MERKELVRKLLEMAAKMCAFRDGLCAIGLDPAGSLLDEIDHVELIAEVYGLTSDDDYNGVCTTHERVFDGCDSYTAENVAEFVRILEVGAGMRV